MEDFGRFPLPRHTRAFRKPWLPNKIDRNHPRGSSFTTIKIAGFQTSFSIGNFSAQKQEVDRSSNQLSKKGHLENLLLCQPRNLVKDCGAF
ncbi:MAG: hypothetical protein C0508_15015 [Cyanobacteria bacterium PR.023]|nr:hypothetical protein [Cyanobacteria bacterium PR.023]